MPDNTVKFSEMPEPDFKAFVGLSLKDIEDFIKEFRTEFKEMQKKVERHDDEIKALQLRAELKMEDKKSDRNYKAAIYSALILSIGSTTVALITLLPSVLRIINGG